MSDPWEVPALLIGGIIAVSVWTVGLMLVRWFVAIVDRGRVNRNG